MPRHTIMNVVALVICVIRRPLRRFRTPADLRRRDLRDALCWRRAACVAKKKLRTDYLDDVNVLRSFR